MIETFFARDDEDAHGNYESVPPAPRLEREPGLDGEGGSLPIYTLTPDRIRQLPEEEVARREREAEAARGARFRELYAMPGLRAAVHVDGELDIAVGATNTKGVMPCSEPG